MSLRITGKHMNVGESLSQRIEDRIDGAVEKYFTGGFTGSVTLEKTGNRFISDCSIHLDTGVVLQATGKEGDANAAFDASAERIEKRLRRYKRKLKDHHGNASSRVMDEAAYAIVQSPDEEEEIPENFNPAIIAESQTNIATQSVAEAVMQLDLTDQPIVVFKNAGNGQTNVVYRRNDGNIGWVDPALAK